mgnify:CR=1 FL=1
MKKLCGHTIWFWVALYCAMLSSCMAGGNFAMGNYIIAAYFAVFGGFWSSVLVGEAKK